ncbi:DNA polymerase III subunit epsilon [Legionella londiniensis]|uniref:DNA polymerase III subunit epsilon n=1 Tax=Legionella londiniensis TaxID=45068 RepID=A0A0W0VKR0_9GAMM|nr:DNA polymerase III subunit epsilon [Legionella londiniensis]KTD20643.1 DNA polymerase III subunit epsilon [Legionella londiniensis]STX92886.1 DNA polymerase III subunit epsilon [Legionella londiniensis]
MRQIVLDTETTGIGFENGHRVIEIGCVEMIDRKITNRHFHVYLNPERAVDEGAFRVHGISTEFLQDKPFFKDILSDFLEFVDDAELIIHNAPFDVGFLNAELRLANWPKPIQKHCRIFDTLEYARKKHPGQRNSLDALCKRYDIDNSNRQLHGALLDAEILAWVYLAMTGGQASLFVEEQSTAIIVEKNQKQDFVALNSATPVIFANEEELARHHEFIEFMIQDSGINLWEEKST